jgi:oligosaccharide repeat unit polymerase
MIEVSLLSKILFSISILLIAEALIKKRDLFSPIRLWTIIWCTVIGLAELKLSYYQREWSLLTWVILITSIGSYILGAFLSHTLFLSEKYKEKKIINESINRKRLLMVILALSVIFIIVFFIETSVSSYGIPAFHPNKAKARTEVGIFAIHLFVEAYVVICLLSAIYFFKIEKKSRGKVLISIFLFITTILYLFLLIRLTLLIILVVTLMYYNYIKRKISLKYLSIVLIIFTIIFIGIQEYRGTSVGLVKKFVYVVSNMKISEDYALFSSPYMYLVMNIENLDEGLKKLQHHTYGAHSFDFLLALCQVKYPLREYIPPKEDFIITRSFNTFPFMWYLYWDFNIFGVMFGSLVLGIIISYSYNLMKFSKKLIHIVIYSYLSVIVFLSFFTSMYSRLGYVFYFFLLIVLTQYVVKYDRS